MKRSTPAALCLCLLAGCGGDDEPREAARTFTLTQPSGDVRARLCDGERIRVTKTIRVRVGCTVVDARGGAVTVVSAGGRARFNMGAFRLEERAGRLSELILIGGDFRSCRPSRRQEVRLLLGDGEGRFRTRGRFASATIRGTKWGTRDLCNGTLLVVREGEIEGRDLVRRRTIRLQAPDQYLVRAPE